MRKMPGNFAVFFMLVFKLDISFRDPKAMRLGYDENIGFRVGVWGRMLSKGR